MCLLSIRNATLRLHVEKMNNYSSFTVDVCGCNTPLKAVSVDILFSMSVYCHRYSDICDHSQEKGPFVVYYVFYSMSKVVQEFHFSHFVTYF